MSIIDHRSFKTALHGTICMVHLYDSYSGLKFSSYKSEEMELILLFKSRIIQILMQNVATILQFTHSDKSNH